MISSMFGRVTVFIAMALSSPTCFAQHVFEGVVRFRGDSSSMPGVSVNEKGTTNETITDEGGAFRIDCKSPNPVLTFSFIGFLRKEVPSPAPFTEVFLDYDEEALREKIRMAAYPRYTEIGFSSGARYTPVGVHLRQALPKLFGMRVYTTTTANYRVNHAEGNSYFSVGVDWDQVIRPVYYIADFGLRGFYRTRTVNLANELLVTRELNVMPTIGTRGLKFGVGYGFQGYGRGEIFQSDRGMVGAITWSLPGYFRISSTARRWKKFWHLDANLSKEFRKTNFSFAVGCELLDRYREIDASVRYRFDY